MEFWGVEVPSGKPLTCRPGADSYVHVSQAALGDNKSAKGSDRVVLKVKVGSIEVVVGTLSQGKCDQTTLDLIFEKDFVLSHNSSGSVFFCGYRTDAVKDDISGSSDEDDLDASDDDSEEEASELQQIAGKENGRLGLLSGKVIAPAKKPLAKTLASKVEASAVEVKSKAKPGNIEELSKGVSEKSDDDEDDEEEDEDEDEDDDILGSGSDKEDLDSEGDSEEDEEESEEEQPKSGKKRALPSGRSVLPVKKNKIGTPAGKLDPKLPSVAASTPKQHQQTAKEVSARKTQGKENAATPTPGKKVGQHYCEPCKKNFNSESALNQHKMAKHK